MKLGVRPKRILLVEDEPTISQVCLRVLSGEFAVDIAMDGALAKRMLVKQRYGLIIIDIMTPVMDGKQLYQYILREYPGIAKRVIFTTGELLGGTKSFIEQSGRPFLPKPFTPAELMDICCRNIC